MSSLSLPGLDPIELAIYERAAGAGPRRKLRPRRQAPGLPGAGVGSRARLALPAVSETTAPGRRGPRRSDRRLWHALPAEGLAAVLYRGLGRRSDGRRPYPTSGGCDELEFLLLARHVAGLEAGAYWIEADGRSLAPQPLGGAATRTILTRVLACLGATAEHEPAAVILVFCQWERLAARYDDCTLVSGLWDCGAALQSLYLAAADAGLPACAVAVLLARDLSAALGVDHACFGHVGTWALGGPIGAEP